SLRGRGAPRHLARRAPSRRPRSLPRRSRRPAARLDALRGRGQYRGYVDAPLGTAAALPRRQAMKLLAGTSKGIFSIGDSGAPVPVLPERSVRDLARSGARLLAGADTGIFASDDGGRAWQPSGIEGRAIWEILPGPDGGRAVYAGSQPAGLFHSKDDGRTWQEVEGFAHAPDAERWCVPTKPPQSGRARALVVDWADP